MLICLNDTDSIISCVCKFRLLSSTAGLQTNGVRCTVSYCLSLSVRTFYEEKWSAASVRSLNSKALAILLFGFDDKGCFWKRFGLQKTRNQSVLVVELKVKDIDCQNV